MSLSDKNMSRLPLYIQIKESLQKRYFRWALCALSEDAIGERIN